MTKNALIKGIFPPIITIFKDDETLDEHAMRAHVDWLITNGVHGVAPCGSTGEFIAMSTDEIKRVISIVVEQAAGRVPVFAGTGSYSTKATIEMSRYAQKAGADGLMVIAPYYMLPPRRNILDHYRALKQSVDLPIIVYNNPWFSGVELTPWELAQLTEEGIIAGVKCAHGDVDRVHNLKYLCGDKLAVMYGHDINAMEGFAAGADGWIAAWPNLIPVESRQLYDYMVVEKNLAKGQELWMRLMPLLQFMSVVKNNEEPYWLSVIKGGLNLLGRKAGKPRRPLTELTADENASLREILKKVGVLKC